LEHFPVKGLGPSRKRIYEKLRILYFIEELMFARREVPTAVLLKIRIFWSKNLEDAGNIFLREVGKYKSSYKAPENLNLEIFFLIT
jgi:hypothetical protein